MENFTHGSQGVVRVVRDLVDGVVAELANVEECGVKVLELVLRDHTSG